MNFSEKLSKLFDKINVKFYILQEYKIENNKRYLGYIYIENFQLLNDYQIEFIEHEIYPIMKENNYEHFYFLSNEYFNLQTLKDFFPIYEQI